MFQGVAFPKGSDIFIPFDSTFSGTVNFTPYSYIVSLTAWSANNSQFSVRIFDKGAQTDLYFGQFAWSSTVASNMQDSPNNGQIVYQTSQNQPFGPYFFRDPLIVLPPGVLQVQLTNLSTTAYQWATPGIQLLFGMAVPKDTVNLQTRKVLSGNDQTGLATLASLVC